MIMSAFFDVLNAYAHSGEFNHEMLEIATEAAIIMRDYGELIRKETYRRGKVDAVRFASHIRQRLPEPQDKPSFLSFIRIAHGICHNIAIAASWFDEIPDEFKEGPPAATTEGSTYERTTEERPTTEHASGMGGGALEGDTTDIENGMIVPESILSISPYDKLVKKYARQYGFDWLLIVDSEYDRLAMMLASYNCGGGGVSRIRKNVGNGAWQSIRNHLPQETQHYVPKIFRKYGEYRTTVGIH